MNAYADRLRAVVYQYEENVYLMRENHGAMTGGKKMNLLSGGEAKSCIALSE